MIGLAVPVLLLVSCLLGAADLDLSADVDRTTIAFGERLLLTVTATGAKVVGLCRPELPVMTDFRLVSTAWSQFASDAAPDSKDSQRTVGFVYTLKPRRTGLLTVGSFKLVHEGKTYETQPIAVRVVPAGERVPPLDRWADANGVELVGTVDRPSVFVGEQVQVTYRLFSRTRVGGAVMKDAPTSDGFWAAEVRDTGCLNWQWTMRGGAPCSVAVVRRAVLFPLQPGTLAVGRMTLAGIVAVGSGLFKGMQTPFTVSSAPLCVTVRPLPDSGMPADFCGGVGKFGLTAELSETITRNGEPLALRVELSGTGNVGTIGEPQVRVADGVKLLSPTVEQQVSREGGCVRGTKTYTYALIPKADGLNIMPATSMSFFDPEGDTYYTLTTERSTFVAAGATRDGSYDRSGPWVRPMGTDIAHIKRSYSRVPPFVASTGWSVLFYPLGTVVLLAGAVVGRHRRRLEADRGYALRFRAKRLLRKRLRESDRRLAAGDERGYYAGLALAVVSYAGDRFNVEVAGMTGSELRDALCRRGLELAAANRVVDFSSRCEVARFSPGAGAFSSQEALSSARMVISIL
jgi:hypothetical protein